MKVIVNHSSLASAFNLAASVAPTRSPKEVLNSVKFSAGPDGLWLTATDVEQGLRIQVSDAEVVSPGDALLPTARMGAILREWNEEKIEIENEDSQVVVSGQHSTFRLPTADPMEYPGIRPCNEDAWTTFPARGLAESLKRTVFACDIASTRYALGGVLMAMDGADSSLVATDGRRLARTTLAGEATGKVTSTGPIVPLKSAVALQRLLSDAETVNASFTTNECWFSTDRGVFWMRLVEGRFPNWRQVIPSFDDWAVDASLPVGPFASLIRQAAIVADSESRGVDFTFAPGMLTAGAQVAELGLSKVDMPVEYDGEPMKVRLDYRFIGDFLRVLDSGSSFRLRVKNSKQPTLLSTEDGYEYVIMPMTLEA